MKVYSTIKNEGEIKIKNKKLKKSGFTIGSRYDIEYREGKIILTIKESKSDGGYKS